MCTITLIIPTLNEAENIDPLLQRIFKVKDDCSFDFDVLFVDSASSDATCEKVLKWKKKYDVSILELESNEGLASAVVAAVRIAKGKVVAVMDADLSHPPEILPALIEPVLSGNYDMVIGSRYIDGGSTPDWPFMRRLGSRVATLPAKLFTRVQDPLAGLFAVDSTKFKCMTGSIRGFKVALEILASNTGSMRVKEVPIEFRERCYGISKMNSSVVWAYLLQLVTLSKKKVVGGL